MKKSFILFTSLFVLSGSLPVFAQEDSNVEDIQAEIESKKEELKELEDKLKELSGEGSEEAEEGSEEEKDEKEKEEKEKDDDSKNKVIGETFEHEGIEVTIDDLYLTEERNEYADKEFENVLVIEYTVVNNTEEDYTAGHDFELYVKGSKAERYFMIDDKGDTISAGRSTDAKASYGFDGDAEEMELEFKNNYSYDGEDPIIIPLEEVEEQ
ncbi:DUF4352 domain-containing protein [Facklamia sp. DSM 111018]|uniref:DUF4352 domain-containing protein n=1 Tax=Facklamia lactis TaxID=2749967 RepID=A0ABS0LRP1_9LACT|nr:DUF4352 domain-containing protein [Facklamia lactis]MBG9980807.1 DUF4352 domain-containing protein [Facklamia lactis]MBG9986830.1 DUF4352 domain-containing protein [Facklamia lactis]